MTSPHGALRRPLSREALLASARHEVRRARGRRRWLVERRLLPVALPAGLAIGALLVSRGQRRRPSTWMRAAGAALLVAGVGCAGALLEWEVRERNHRRRERLVS